jgi:hypothetical protein
MPVGIARDHHADANSFRPRGQRREQRPPFQAGAIGIPTQWHEVIEDPTVFEGWRRVCLLEDAQDVIPCRVLWRRFDAEP